MNAAPELDEYGRHLMATFPTRFFATAREAMDSSSAEVSASSTVWVLSSGVYTWTDAEGWWVHPEYDRCLSLRDFCPDELLGESGSPTSDAPPPVEIATRSTTDDPNPAVDNFGLWELVDDPFEPVFDARFGGPSTDSNEPDDFAPLFDFAQPDGSTSILDFGTPGGFGDLVVAVADPTGRHRLEVYHTGESLLLIGVLAQMGRQLAPAQILADIERIHAALDAAGVDELATSESEHNFRREFLGVEQAAAGESPAAPIRLHNEHGRELIVTPHDAGLWFDQELSENGRFDVFIPNDSLWAFATGLIWRTFGERRFAYSTRSRNNTAAYVDGIDHFTAAVERRHDTG